MKSDPNEWASRFPFADFYDAFFAIQEGLLADPRSSLRQLAQGHFDDRSAEIDNVQERGQILLNAVAYYERNRLELDCAGGLIAGSRDLLDQDFLAALYALVMQSPWDNPNIVLPASEFLKLMKRQKDAREGMRS